jgi:hypothetical protein
VSIAARIAIVPSPLQNFVIRGLVSGRITGKPEVISSFRRKAKMVPCVLTTTVVCYSWVTGIADVAQVVFVRKRLVEIQYFRTVISDEQREEFGHLVQDSDVTVGQELGGFDPVDRVATGSRGFSCTATKNWLHIGSPQAGPKVAAVCKNIHCRA